jgi:hypothetical protein
LSPQSIPDCFSRWPTTVLQPASTTPKPMNGLLASEWVILSPFWGPNRI